MTEEELIAFLNNKFPFMDTLVKCEDEFSHYDCDNSSYIIEIKSRDKNYNPWLIEKAKYDSNYKASLELTKEFIYLTEYRRKIITWNINDLVNNDYNFGWTLKELPETTEFKANNLILKEVGYLYEEYGKRIEINE